MEFRFNTEQELFRKSVREWATKNLEPRARQIDAEENGVPDDLVQQMVDLGIFGLTVPEEYGGCAVPGEELLYSMIAVQEIAKADLSMSVPVYALLTIGWSYICLLYTSDAADEEDSVDL